MCVPKSSGDAAIIVSSLALPFHILMAKVLVKDVGLTLPHHQIMLSLTISDALQIFGVASLAPFVLGLQLTTESFLCDIVRDISVFLFSLTVFVSSLVLITLAIERMMICIHFLKYRQLFRKARMTKLLSSHWLFGMIIAAIATATNDARKSETSINEATSFQIVCVVTILPSAFIITVVYIRIFLFSRERVARVIPRPVSSSMTYTNVLKKKQIRVAVVSGVVCVAYVGCMVPIAMTYFLELTGLIKHLPNEKNIIICIAMVNNFIDPLIYGFGMAETRQVLIKTMKNVFRI